MNILFENKNYLNYFDNFNFQNYQTQVSYQNFLEQVEENYDNELELCEIAIKNNENFTKSQQFLKQYITALYRNRNYKECIINSFPFIFENQDIDIQLIWSLCMEDVYDSTFILENVFEENYSTYKKNLNFMYCYAKTCRYAEDFSKSMQLFEECLQIQPNNPEILRELANSYALQSTQQSLQKAGNCYSSLLIVNPLDTQAYKDYSIILRKIGDLQESVQVLKKYLEIVPNNLDSHYQIAELYEEQNLIQDQVKEYQQILKKDKTQRIAYLKLSDIYRSQKNFSEYSNILYQGYENDSNNQDFLFRIMKCFQRKKAYRKQNNLQNIKTTFLAISALNYSKKTQKVLYLMEKINKKSKNYFPQYFINQVQNQLQTSKNANK